MKANIKIFTFFLFLCSGTGLYAVGKNTSQPTDETKREADAGRLAKSLITKMTVEEKVLQLLSFVSNGVPRLGIPAMTAYETLHGVVSNSCTSFPQSIAMAASFDPALLKEVAVVIAKEARAVGIVQSFSPMLGVARDPRWGRVEESYGEDPLLVSRMGVAYINGLQGEGKNRFGKENIFATPKHFVADGEPWGGMNGVGAEITERTLREIYFPPFEAAVKVAKTRSVMPAHHAINGIPCHANGYLLQQVLHNEWGFKGFVTSDMDDINKIYNGGGFNGYHYARNTPEACIMALEAGVDMELVGKYYKDIPTWINEGKISMKVIDRAVERVLRSKIILLGLTTPSSNQQNTLKSETETAITTYKGTDDIWAKLIAAGKFDTPESGRKPDWKQIVTNPAHDSLALKAAGKSIVLLKNTNALLPLKRSGIKRILVAGSFAVYQNLGGYSTGNPKFYTNILEGIKMVAGENIGVVFSSGYSIPNSQKSYNGVLAVPLNKETEEELIRKAVNDASDVDLVVCVVGHARMHVGENLDRDDLNLIGFQEDMVKALHATGKPVVVVVNSGAPISVNWLDQHVPAILQVFYAGQSTGTAVAQALFGDINPGGKMPLSTPRTTGQIPCYYNHPPLTGPVNFYGSKGGVLYPFGHGLSYTTFKYTGLSVDKKAFNYKDSVIVAVTIENSGSRAGDEVVQLYLHQDYTSLVRPVKELKGFERVSLKPGEKKMVRFKVGFDEIKFWKDKKWVAENGIINLMVGSSSDDIRLRSEITYSGK